MCLHFSLIHGAISFTLEINRRNHTIICHGIRKRNLRALWLGVILYDFINVQIIKRGNRINPIRFRGIAGLWLGWDCLIGNDTCCAINRRDRIITTGEVFGLISSAVLVSIRRLNFASRHIINTIRPGHINRLCNWVNHSRRTDIFDCVR